MPFVEPAFLRYMIQLSSRFDIVIPNIAGHYEPLLAIYARSLLPKIEHALAHGEMRMIGIFDGARMRHVFQQEITRFDPEMRSFFNVNTPEDLACAQDMLRTASR
jgi:molybdopterin-guanine dinucleotide biosynthesis protein A